jgi:hypothetical protein
MLLKQSVYKERTMGMPCQCVYPHVSSLKPLTVFDEILYRGVNEKL